MTSLARGLEILRLLNIRDRVTLTQLVTASQLPRGTVYRILQSLQAKGYVVLERRAGTYALTRKVLALSHGFDEEAWTSEAARPILDRLGQQVGWPLGLATLVGTTVVLRENTDAQSSLVFNVVKTGYQMRILASASGWTLLAFSEDKKRVALLDALEKMQENSLWLGTPTKRQQTLRLLESIRQQGFCCQAVNQKVTALSVPVMGDGGLLLAAFSLRFFTSAMTQNAAIRDYLPRLQDSASEIAKGYLEWLGGNKIPAAESSEPLYG